MSSLLAHPDHARLIRHLDNVAVLSDSDKQALCTLPLVIKVFDADEEVVHERDRVGSCCLLLDGFMHRYKVLANGERQIIAFHFPGDIPDLLTLHLSIMDHNLGTLVPSRLAFIAHSALRSLALERPGIGVALWRDTLIDASVFREWIVNVGRRDARERISHLLCEIYMRLNAVGLAETDGYALHLTQREIGEATGLTPVHVNRTLQDLRRSGLIASESRYLRILDWPGLQAAAGFDSAYLHLRDPDAD